MSQNKNLNCKTVQLKSAFDAAFAYDFYERLRDGIEWIDGIPSKVHGYTRKAYPVDLHDPNPSDLELEIKIWIEQAIAILKPEINKNVTRYKLLGTYLNYYVDEENFTPNHSHPGQHQIVISLGATRILQIGQKSYTVENGDIVLFGGSVHGVPKETQPTEGRISIATFMVPEN